MKRYHLSKDLREVWGSYLYECLGEAHCWQINNISKGPEVHALKGSKEDRRTGAKWRRRRAVGNVTWGLVSEDISKKSLKYYEQKGSTIKFSFEKNFSPAVLITDFKGQRLKQGDELGYRYSIVHVILPLEAFFTNTVIEMFSCQYLELYLSPLFCLTLFQIIINHFLVEGHLRRFHCFAATTSAIMKTFAYSSLYICRCQVELSNAIMNPIGILIGTTLNLVCLGEIYICLILNLHS